jgi:plastocyanin
MRTRRGIAGLLATLAGIALVAVPAQEGRAEAQKPGRQAIVDMVGLRAVPPRLEVATGAVVVWRNQEPVDYPVAGGGHELFSQYYGAFESPKIAPGERWAHRFLWPGSYKYRCKWHPGTVGEVIVTGEPVDDPDQSL